MSPEIPNSQIQANAWRLAGDVAKLLPMEVRVADLHPGGGQYECLSLITAAEPTPIFMVNRVGQSANLARASATYVWRRMETEGSKSLANELFRNSGIPSNANVPIFNVELANSCFKIADWISTNSSKAPIAVCFWFDSPEYVGQSEVLINGFEIPEIWREFDAPYEGSDWSAWVYALFTREDPSSPIPVAAINLKLNQAVDPEGKEWRAWLKKKPMTKAKIKELEKKKIVAKSIQTKTSKPTSTNPFFTHEESANRERALELFRKLNGFDGYKAMGGSESLENFANAVMEQWHKDSRLPESLDALKSALFYEFRRSHFISGYPDESQLPYLQALADAIEEKTNLKD